MRFAADENFDGRILDGIRRRLPDLDIVRIQDTEMYGASDAEMLEWVAQEGRILLSRDVQTLIDDAYDRVKRGLPMPGVIIVQMDAGIGKAIEALEIAIVAGRESDFENQVAHVSS